MSFLGRVLAWLVILGAVTVIIVAVVVPRVAGATPYTILTGSMEPRYPPGTLVVVKPVDTADLSVGDVVTVQLETGESDVVTHRISAIKNRLDGEVRFETKGDANDSVDVDLRQPEQIRGELWYAVPYVGYVSQLFTGSERQLLVLVVAGGLLVYAAYMFLSARRERDKQPEADAPVDSSPDAKKSRGSHRA